MRFFLLAAKFFNQGYKEIFSLIQSRRGVYPKKKVLVVSLTRRYFYSLMPLNLYLIYSNLPQNWRGGATLKEKFSSSRCQRDKEISLWGFTLPLHFKSLESVGLPASTLKKKFSSSRCQRDKELPLWGFTLPPSIRWYTLKEKFSSSRWQRDIFDSLGHFVLCKK